MATVSDIFCGDKKIAAKDQIIAANEWTVIATSDFVFITLDFSDDKRIAANKD